ncbi:MAG: LysM peptidoglycan-binding domain-containing protein [Pseudomonadota bacterium]|nr:LysM peptidoglycan-binding domain-containing protein [Xanthomonadaceae bacterium]MDE3210879.1 LysM peptidoglycan-binding domain-containing protein [Pseudomonadota bacterium]
MGGSGHPVAVATTLRIAPLALLLLAGCASIPKPRVLVQPVAATAAAPSAEPAATTSIAAIIHEQILRGHYGEAERALRDYLAQHPGDRQAQALLRQLTADPRRMLGPVRSTYVVQPGDSYSILAARYLGDPGLFVALARYNGSTNPSLLRAGERLKMPAPVAGGSPPPSAPVDAARQPAADAAAVAAESPAAKAAGLQRQATALMKQGRQDQALARLDQALAVDPRLGPDGPASIALRKQLVASDHQRAIVLYRDQHLAQAIALWDRVLAIDPGFEPAIIYRARAKELQLRLKQL